MHPFGVLDREYLDNSLRTWLVALAIFAGVLVVQVVAREFVRRYLVRRAKAGGVDENAAAHADSIAAEQVHRTRYFFFFAVAIAVASLSLDLPPGWRQAIGDLTICAGALQVALWGDGLIAYGIHQYVVRQRWPEGVDPSHAGANKAAIGAVGVAARLLLWALVTVIALDSIGVRVTTLVTGLGISGIAVALALQSVLGDAFAALSIVLDKPFVIGENIGVDTVRGRVERIGMKNTRLIATTGEMVVIANADLLKSRIQNFSRMVDRTTTFTLTLDPKVGPDAAARVPGLIRDVVLAQSGVIFVRSHVTLPTAGGTAVETVYTVTSPEYLRFAEAQQAITLGVLRGLDQAGVALTTSSGPTVVVSAPGAATATAPVASAAVASPLVAGALLAGALVAGASSGGAEPQTGKPERPGP